MAFFKLILAVCVLYGSSALAARIPSSQQDFDNEDAVQQLQQRQENTFIDNRSNSNEQLRRQDEYLRNIDHSAVSIQNPNFQQQSNRLQDNEYRRTNYYYDANQQERQIYQNQEQEQQQQLKRQPQTQPQYQFIRQLYGEPLLIAQASSAYPIIRNNWNAAPYNSRVSFNSPLVSYRY